MLGSQELFSMGLVTAINAEWVEICSGHNMRQNEYFILLTFSVLNKTEILKCTSRIQKTVYFAKFVRAFLRAKQEKPRIIPQDTIGSNP
jgi:hypothetical protein